jgi:hypothetical protein
MQSARQGRSRAGRSSAFSASSSARPIGVPATPGAAAPAIIVWIASPLLAHHAADLADDRTAS